jgi:hypothetical protein
MIQLTKVVNGRLRWYSNTSATGHIRSPCSEGSRQITARSSCDSKSPCTPRTDDNLKSSF